jgi:N-acetyl-gamma-glutamyl-phosphate reductase
MTTVGIIGASGFTGAELLRLCAGHPDLDIHVATGDTQAGTAVAELYPSLAGGYPDLMFEAYTPELVDGLDVVFLGLPHGASQAIIPEIIDRVGHVLDLGADYRLDDPELYPQWYGEAHTSPELLSAFAYGLPELFRAEIGASTHVAVPGCYPTTASLAIAPFTRGGHIDLNGIVVDAASGVSGAGRPPKPNTTFCTVDEDFTAYGLLTHRHTPEIEQVTGSGPVIFTPHMAPMNRGILATCYGRPNSELDTAGALKILTDFYADEPFIVVSERSPSTKATLGSNTAHLTARVDPRTGYLVAICAIDNLAKGASGGAVQCANILLGLPETTGLSSVGMYP